MPGYAVKRNSWKPMRPSLPWITERSGEKFCSPERTMISSRRMKQSSPMSLATEEDKRGQEMFMKEIGLQKVLLSSQGMWHVELRLLPPFAEQNVGCLVFPMLVVTWSWDGIFPPPVATMSRFFKYLFIYLLFYLPQKHWVLLAAKAEDFDYSVPLILLELKPVSSWLGGLAFQFRVRYIYNQVRILSRNQIGMYSTGFLYPPPQWGLGYIPCVSNLRSGRTLTGPHLPA